MGVKLTRVKKANYLGSFFYFFKRILPLSAKAKHKLFLNLEWVFSRFSYEYSVRMYTYESHPVVAFRLKFLKQYIKSDQSVVDLGCGNGLMSSLIAPFAQEVIGIDYDKQAIEKAKKNYVRDNLHFYNCDAVEFLEKNNKRYDVLILSHILEHIDNPRDFLLKYIRFFNYVYVELPDFDGSVLNHFRKDQNLKLIYTDDDHLAEFDRNELKEMLRECDIELLEAEYIFSIQRYWCRIKHAELPNK